MTLCEALKRRIYRQTLHYLSVVIETTVQQVVTIVPQTPTNMTGMQKTTNEQIEVLVKESHLPFAGVEYNNLYISSRRPNQSTVAL